MSSSHPNLDVEEMAKEFPMRRDLRKMELHPDPEIATAQIIIRQAVPIPLHETLIKKLQGILAFILNKS